MTRTLQTGFTLIELLIVIAVIGVLAAIVIIAVNPGRQVDQANNAARESHVTEILNAISQYTVDNDGNLPTGIDTTSRVVGTCAAGATCTAVAPAAACLNLTAALTPTYVPSIPTDPETGSAADTDYYVVRDANNRVTIGACEPALGRTISATR